MRRDIQGLRAVAVGAVVLFHAWPRRMPGGYVGVDVFFVISGFLISSHLFSDAPNTGRDLARFWSRRIRRLLPAALLVLTVTLVVSRLVAPALQWAHTAREAMAASLYVENWSLASQALDYLNADTAATPVQHFWSLSAEEQFYAVWPVLLLVAGLVARAAHRRRGAFVLVALAAVFSLSLAASVHATRTEPARAYFVTYTRAWEFALGALVAWVAFHTTRRWSGLTADLGAWLGLAAIAIAAFAFSGKTPFPGYVALLPVLGTGAVLLAASEGRAGPGVLWRLPGVQWLGDVSYSVYLWHWPALLLAPFVLGSQLSWPTKLLVLSVTLALAGLSKVLVEDRFRNAPKGTPLRRTFALAVLGMAVVVGLSLLQLAEVSRKDAQARAQLRAAEASPSSCFGAGAAVLGRVACPVNDEARLVPDLSIAGDDKSDAYRNKCFVEAPLTARLTCTFGHGPTKVALVGNSHAGHWLPALQRLADERGWTITTYLVSICNVSDAETSMQTAELRHNCSAYGRWVFDQTKGHTYDLVFTSERQSARVSGNSWGTSEAAGAAGYSSYLRRWVASGARIVVLTDVLAPPTPLGRIPDCLAKHPGDRSQCSWAASVRTPTDKHSYRWMDPLSDAAQALRSPRVSVLSLNDLLCPAGTCQPVIGTVVTYFDASHLTATFARTLAPELGARLDRLLAHG